MGRTRWTWLALGFATMACVHATVTTSGSADSDRQQIAALEEDWIKAVITRDAAAFDRLLHATFTYTEDGKIYSRAQLISDVQTTADTVTSGRNEDMSVRVSGTVGIVTGWLVLVGRGGGNAFERRYRYTDTWVKDGGRWRAIAAQDYLQP
ncbi:MAG TPA: nuclear transport factor 2 family protein [Gemmatimonadaceae bacterium]|nr:nuclear transport factor 2 family protein [Gemmatimonadaceae bacterium]